MTNETATSFTGRRARLLALAIGGLALASSASLPPPEYVIDYYAPPTDWLPEREIAEYTLNTRVPDLFWLDYDGANALALRIRPISKEIVEKEIAARAIDPSSNKGALSFDLAAEKDRRNRRIVIRDLNVPADDFTELSFKMRSTCRNAGQGIEVEAIGVGTLRTEKALDPATKCRDGFQSYKLPLQEKAGRVLKGIAITLPEATAEDFEQEFVLIDFHFRRKEAKARFEDLPPRRWIRKEAFEKGKKIGEGDAIEDICSFVRSSESSKGLDGLVLPFDYEPLAEKVVASNHIQTAVAKASIEGRDSKTLRITMKKGPPCFLRFPVAFDATKVNTMTFYARIELPEGIPSHRLLGGEKPMLWGTDAGTVNSYFDTFSFGTTSASHDAMNWIQYGVAQGSFGWHRQQGRPIDTWTPVALDIVNDDFTGNKGTYNPKTTHWCFYYDCRKIPDGATVTVEIADPRVTGGLMLAGGEMDLYRSFVAETRSAKTGLKSDRSFLEPPTDGRLEKPLPFIRKGEFLGEIIYAPDPASDHLPAYRVIVERALGNFNAILTNQYAVSKPIPILEKPSEKDNVKIFIGSGWYEKVDPKQYAADMKRMDGTPGCAIRSQGKKIYLYAAPYGYRGNARGLANAIYVLLENNTDAIMALGKRGKGTKHEYVVFDSKAGQEMDIVWGDGYCHVPPLLDWGIGGTTADFNDFNRSSWYTVWGDWDHGGVRAQSCNHWWGYGTSKTPDETWGIGMDGKPMKPGCYTGHPCLINVLDRAKDAYLKFAFQPAAWPDRGQSDDKEPPIYRVKDVMGLWVEDTLKICQCPKCAKPIRLPDGSLVKRGEKAFLSTQFFANGCAMINYINVFARRDMKIESIAYFWMAEIPLFEISRNYKVRYCPYIRKNYMVPIYAPCNDLFWRAFCRWGQQDVTLAMYEYFLDVNLRPWTEMYAHDFPEVVGRGLDELNFEGDSGIFPAMERWVSLRLMWDPSLDVRRLRSYFLRRTYREAAPAMERFFNTMYDLVREDFTLVQPMEFEDSCQLGHLFLRTPSKAKAGKSVADELTDDLDEAAKAVRNESSREVLALFRKEWDGYLEKARKTFPGKVE